MQLGLARLVLVAAPLLALAAAATVPPCLVTQLDAGASHVCIVDTLQNSKCWGEASSGALGNGEAANVANVAVPGHVLAAPDGRAPQPNILDVSAGGRTVKFLGGVAHLFSHTCFRVGPTGGPVTNVGVMCVGDNSFGQAGGDRVSELYPAPILCACSWEPLMGVTSISAGGTHTLALLSDGTVAAWGENTDGQLGDGNGNGNLGGFFPEESAEAVRVLTGVNMNALSDVRQVAAGGLHSCVRQGPNNVVMCWGNNEVNQASATQHTVNLDFPTRVPLNGGGFLEQVRFIAAGGDHTCVVVDDATGRVMCWGASSEGQTGTGSTALTVDHPTFVIVSPGNAQLANVVSLSLGEEHGCASTSAGLAYCWGDNSQGQLGDGTTTSRSEATPVMDPRTGQPLSNVASVSCGSFFTYFVMRDATIFGVGDSSSLQLGPGSPFQPVPGVVCTWPACKGPPSITIANATWERCADVPVGNTCRALCDEGFAGSGQTATCTAINAAGSGWSSFVPGICSPKPCPDIPTGVSYAVWSCNNNMPHGSTCVASCTTGPTATPPTASCWLGRFNISGSCPPPPCTGTPPQGNPSNGTWQCNVTTASGSACVAACDAGFQGSPTSPTSTCTAGAWSSTQGACQPIPCLSSPPLLESPGLAGGWSCNSSLTPSGTVCTATCAPGLSGSFITTCVRGAFSAVAGSCVNCSLNLTAPTAPIVSICHNNNTITASFRAAAGDGTHTTTFTASAAPLAAVCTVTPSTLQGPGTVPLAVTCTGTAGMLLPGERLNISVVAASTAAAGTVCNDTRRSVTVTTRVGPVPVVTLGPAQRPTPPTCVGAGAAATMVFNYSVEGVGSTPLLQFQARSDRSSNCSITPPASTGPTTGSVTVTCPDACVGGATAATISLALTASGGGCGAITAAANATTVLACCQSSSVAYARASAPADAGGCFQHVDPEDRSTCRNTTLSHNWGYHLRAGQGRLEAVLTTGIGASCTRADGGAADVGWVSASCNEADTELTLRIKMSRFSRVERRLLAMRCGGPPASSSPRARLGRTALPPARCNTWRGLPNPVVTLDDTDEEQVAVWPLPLRSFSHGCRCSDLFFSLYVRGQFVRPLTSASRVC